MKAGRLALAFGGLVLAASGLTVGGCRKAPAPATPAAPVAEPAAPPESIVLFFVSAEGDLQRESREVPELPTAPQARIRLVLEELLLGSKQGLTSPFPWPAAVRTVFVDAQGTAYVDLTPAPPADAVMGSNAETTMAYATVNSVVANCHGIQRVQILFDGREVDTLGHLDLSRPLLPQTGMVAQ
jgi:hypothetical protein